MALMSLVESAKRFSDDGRLGAQDARPVHILFNKTEGRGGGINKSKKGWDKLSAILPTVCSAPWSKG